VLFAALESWISYQQCTGWTVWGVPFPYVYCRNICACFLQQNICYKPSVCLFDAECHVLVQWLHATRDVWQ